MSTWPPLLADLQTDRGVTVGSDDTALSTDLASAVAFVQRVRPTFNYDSDPLSCRPAPTADVWAGTLALAWRWFTRRRSPDGLIDMGELGQGRVPTVDRDIERLLGIGPFKAPVIA
jgi:hypothetical protein